MIEYYSECDNMNVLVTVNCILRAPAVADALTTGRGAVIERSAGGAGQDYL